MRKLIKRWLGISRLEFEENVHLNYLRDYNGRLNKLENDRTPHCYKFDDALPDDSIIAYVAKFVQALKTHMDIEMVPSWEDDPMYAPVEQPKRKVWKIVKKKRLAQGNNKN